jgi:hypothetical protein
MAVLKRSRPRSESRGRPHANGKASGAFIESKKLTLKELRALIVRHAKAAKSFRQLAEKVQDALGLLIIQESIAQAKAGKGRPMREALRELAARHGIELSE